MNRKDFKIIAEWIQKDSTVLDLGCGDSTLLDYLASNKNISGYGFEKDIDKVQESIKKNINVIQSDFNTGLAEYFESNFFDYSIMTQALQENKSDEIMSDENISQIDLARAFIESNETEDAINLIKKIIDTGTEEEKHEAKLLYMQVK